MLKRVRKYYRLTKPGIIYGNPITASAGFFLASKGVINFGSLISTIFGLSLIIASGCVFNNYTDRGIDEKMERTKNRALVKGTISPSSALVFGSILGILGTLILFLFTNLLALAIALAGLFFYVVLYGIAKRGTVYSTIIGSVSGAVPPVVGYASVSNQLDLGALLLFLILAIWQMPHFYSIAIFRKKEYEAAKLPVLPVKKGLHETKIHIILYITAFTIAVSLLFVLGYTGYAYFAAVMTAAVLWFRYAVLGFRIKENEIWAKNMFRFSLIILLIFSIMISLDAFLF